MSYVKLGPVRVFASAVPDKEQALKPLEEASEVRAAWQDWSKVAACFEGDPEMQFSGRLHAELLDEIADCIQACCNLAASIGVTDLTSAMAECERRNRERGRYE